MWVDCKSRNLSVTSMTDWEGGDGGFLLKAFTYSKSIGGVNIESIQSWLAHQQEAILMMCWCCCCLLMAHCTVVLARALVVTTMMMWRIHKIIGGNICVLEAIKCHTFIKCDALYQFMHLLKPHQILCYRFLISFNIFRMSMTRGRHSTSMTCSLMTKYWMVSDNEWRTAFNTTSTTVEATRMKRTAPHHSHFRTVSTRVTKAIRVRCFVYGAKWISLTRWISLKWFNPRHPCPNSSC